MSAVPLVGCVWTLKEATLMLLFKSKSFAKTLTTRGEPPEPIP